MSNHDRLVRWGPWVLWWIGVMGIMAGLVVIWPPLAMVAGGTITSVAAYLIDLRRKNGTRNGP